MPSPAEPVTELKKVKIIESGEPMINFLKLCSKLLFDPPRFNYERETLMRETPARMLCTAAEYLPSGYRLSIIEGWRAPHIQRRMYQAIYNRFQQRHPDWSDVKRRRVVNRYSAPLHGKVPPPHTTGGAVDLVLANDEGKPYDLTSPFKRTDPKCYAFDAEGLSDESRKNRAILKEALERSGLTNYPSEYWHWSYGDQGWAYRGEEPHALYGPIEPDGWSPRPEEDVEEPLTYLFS